MLERYPTLKRGHITSLIVLVLMVLVAPIVVPAQSIFAAAMPQEGIAVANLNIRSGPGPQFEIIGVLSKGQDVTILGQNVAGSWLRIGYGSGRWGWSAARYIDVQPAMASMQVVNETSTEVCWLYASPTTSSTWGDDRLGPYTTIAPGESFILQIDEGEYDLRAEDCDGNLIDEAYAVTILGDDMIWDVYDNY